MFRISIAMLALGLVACGAKSDPAPIAPDSAATAAHAGEPMAAPMAEASYPERPGAVARGDSPLTLVGDAVEVGQPMPPFVLTANDMSPLSSEQYADKVLVLSVVPSLDTGVCALQTRTFNQQASQLSDDVVIVTVSMDLPFAQKRFCGAEGIDRVITASDFKERSFGRDFGVLIKEMGLLTRAVFVVGRDHKVVHVEYVADISQEPDYDSALGAVSTAL